MIEKIKTHWKEILIGLFVLLSMNQCAKRCTNGQHYRNEVKISDSLQTLVNSQVHDIEMLKTDTANYLNQIRMLKGFESKRDTQDSINNANLAAQKEQTDRLIQQNRKLINSSKK